MLCEAVLPPMDADAIIFQPSDDGKEKRRPSAPEGRVAVPEKIATLLVPKPNQLGAKGGDLSFKAGIR
ncbi:MAG: hypothetical protein K0S56_2825 [Microvirga sp.]|nr:hypothetical protein [Microvirga sp.]